MKIMKFICAHKDFDIPSNLYIDKDSYIVVSPRRINCPFRQMNYKTALDDRLWSEWSGIKYVRDNIDAEWYGVNHYRRLSMEYKDHIGYAENIEYALNNVTQYSLYHNLEDLNIAANCIMEKYPHLYGYFVNTMSTTSLVPYNIVYFPKDIFYTWVDIVVDVCQGVLDYYGIVIYEDMLKHIETNHEKYIDGKGGQNGTVGYQARMVSFLSERITTAFIAYLKDREVCYPMKVRLLEEGQVV